MSYSKEDLMKALTDHGAGGLETVTNAYSKISNAIDDGGRRERFEQQALGIIDDHLYKAVDEITQLGTDFGVPAIMRQGEQEKSIANKTIKGPAKILLDDEQMDSYTAMSEYMVEISAAIEDDSARKSFERGISKLVDDQLETLPNLIAEIGEEYGVKTAYDSVGDRVIPLVLLAAETLKANPQIPGAKEELARREVEGKEINERMAPIYKQITEEKAEAEMPGPRVGGRRIAKMSDDELAATFQAVSNQLDDILDEKVARGHSDTIRIGGSKPSPIEGKSKKETPINS